MKNLVLMAILCVLPGSALACENSSNKEPFQRHSLLDTTPETIACDYQNENKNGLPPQIGLALSGGGTRAAYFSLGVMAGLNDAGILEKVDVISSVSGGGYAAYWYFSRRMEAKRLGYLNNDIFADCMPAWWVEFTTKTPTKSDKHLRNTLNAADNQSRCKGSNTAHFTSGDPYRWQAWLARWPDLFNVEPIKVTGDKQGKLTKGFVFTTLKKAVFQHLYQMMNATGLAIHYENAIDRVWGLEPLPRKDSQDQPFAWRFANNNPDVRLGNAEFNTRSDIMNWIKWRAWRESNSSAQNWVLNGRIHHKGRDSHPEYIYEMTGYAHGSQSTGYSNQRFSDGTLRRAVRASGAFADYQGLQWLSLPYAFAKVADLITGLVSWGVSIKSPDDGRMINVSDGGTEDNTGVYSLIRRGVKEIILVDASYDLSGAMEDLCNIPRTLNIHIQKGQQGFRLSINGLQNFDQLCAENAGGKVKKGYNTSAWLNPVLEGEIRWPVSILTGKEIMPPVKLYYIKLAWNQLQARWAFKHDNCGQAGSDYFSCMVTAYYGSNTIVINTKDEYMIFPQLGTVGITYNSSTYLFWAYRELGRSIGKRFSLEKSFMTRHLSLNKKTHCLQSLLDVQRDQRPVKYSLKKSWSTCATAAE